MSTVALSVVLPAHNEADNIAESVQRAWGVLSGLGLSGEVLVVDDGSTDDTAGAVEALGAGVSLLRHRDNLGYGAALVTGFRAARGERIFFTDADLQFDLDDLRRLLPHGEAFDIVAGYRQPRRDPLGRRLSARAWGGLVNHLFDVRIRDVNCAFKLLHRRVLEGMELASTGAFINTELLARARAAGFSVAELPVRHYPRRRGVQSGARPAVVARAFAELWALRQDLR